MARASQLERAFELARTPQYRSVDDIKKRLFQEEIGTKQIDGPVLWRQLRDATGDALLIPKQRPTPLR